MKYFEQSAWMPVFLPAWANTPTRAKVTTVTPGRSQARSQGHSQVSASQSNASREVQRENFSTAARPRPSRPNHAAGIVIGISEYIEYRIYNYTCVQSRTICYASPISFLPVAHFLPTRRPFPSYALPVSFSLSLPKNLNCSLDSGLNRLIGLGLLHGLVVMVVKMGSGGGRKILSLDFATCVGLAGTHL
ncbi:hypothetical protein FN846DRAFT_576201 [Sphaerosporella brunnea]|uniref:Uncharacterized protein n=1 Tax=Sphaerosporella brunnea TaxID=1250544 RepID=A0A5J5F2P2_9PEZI|nr:hypothetical protein FN846DRAFT_576201 [Sphaerosporella brunnea]